MSESIRLKNNDEAYVLLRWLHSRLIENNKNVLSAELGATGSGKSYRDLRKAELWYKYHFKEEFPVENICFGVPQVIRLISSGKMRRGEIIIFEEAGVNLGSLDFQNKIAKMFTYVLQSFRSMNIAIFMNLPYLSMLNKQARMLLHFTSESKSIDFKLKLNKCKPKFIQINQSTGKMYPKFLIVKNSRGKVGKVKQISYNLPSKYLIDAYEKRKQEYLMELTGEFNKTIEKMNNNEQDSTLEGKYLTGQQKEVLELNIEGYNQKEIAIKLKKTQPSIASMLKTIEKRGYAINRGNYSKEKPKIEVIGGEDNPLI